jgi:hypothetical protein
VDGAAAYVDDEGVDDVGRDETMRFDDAEDDPPSSPAASSRD